MPKLENSKAPVVTVIGLGKVGLALASVWLKSGSHVVGLEKSPTRVSQIENPDFIEAEPEVSSRLGEFGSKFKVNDWGTAINHSQIFMCIVPTPSIPEEGRFSSEFVAKAWEELCAAIRDSGAQDLHRLFVVKSTVNPGDCKNLLERIRKDFHEQSWELVYNPEFIALGDVVHGMEQPDLVLYGIESESQLSQSYFAKWEKIRISEPRVHVLNLEGAEIAKIAVNTFVTTKISFANLIGQLSEAHGVKDPLGVLMAVGDDPRIGRAYLRPGLGYGGPCFPRDNKALASSLSAAGLPRNLPDAIDYVNEATTGAMTRRILAELDLNPKAERKVLFLGISYKPGTPIVEESKALALALSLAREGIQLEVFDPMASATEHGLKPYKPSSVLVNDFSLVVLAVGWSDFASIVELANKQGVKVMKLTTA